MLSWGLYGTQAELILLPSGDGTTEGVLGYGLPQACTGEHDPQLTSGWMCFWSSQSYMWCSITHTSAAVMNRKVEGLTVLGNMSCCSHCDSCQWLMQPTGSHCFCPAPCWWGLSAPPLLSWLRAGVPVPWLFSDLSALEPTFTQPCPLCSFCLWIMM